MIRRTLIACVLTAAFLLPASYAVSQEPPLPAGQPVRVAIETSAGTILAETSPRAPITSANFLRYVDERRFDGASFYRAMEVIPGVGLVQGGVQGVAGKVLPPIAHEPTSETGLSHVDGALSMARFDPGSATGDFFIIVGNLTSLDAGKALPGDPGFAVFGRVVEGMDIVRQMLGAPKSPTEGDGAMQGQMLEPRVRILSIRRVEAAEQ